MTHMIDGALPAPVRAADASARAAHGAHAPARPQSTAQAGDRLQLTGEAAGLQVLQRQLGAAPAGVDVARVNEVRAALADGSYRIDADRIAARMLASEAELIK